MNRFLLTLVLLLTSSLAAFSQTATGIPPFSSTTSGPDVINLGNLNIHVCAPILNKPGRGLPFTYSLCFDNSIWTPVGSSGSQSWQPAVNWGWQAQTSALVGFLAVNSSSGSCNYGYRGQSVAYFTVSAYPYYVDRLGAQHIFSPVPVSVQNTGGCGPTQSQFATAGTATDGSGIGYDLGTTNVTFRDGIATNPPIGSINGAATARDTNGNQITTAGGGNFTDTLGQTVLTVSGVAPANTTYQYQDSNGNPQNVTVSYIGATVQTNFPCSVSQYGATSTYLISRITYPDHSYYEFTYEPTSSGSGNVTGRLKTVRFPSGGTISYDYSGSIACADGSTSSLTRTTPDSPQPWSYSRSNVSGSEWTTSITDPTGNSTQLWFQNVGANYYETKRQISQYVATPSPHQVLLRTIETCYNGAAYDCSGTGVTLPINEVDRLTILDNNWQSQTRTLYNSSSLPTEFDEYDFGPGGAGAVLRKTLTTYSSLGNGIVDRPASVTIQDGSGTTKALTNYYYDQGTPAPTSGVPQHIAISGSRGNLTEISQWLNTTGTYLNTNLTYEDTGDLLTSTDPGGHQTQFSYADSFAGNQTPNAHAYVTTVTMPSTQSPNTAQHATTIKYDINTGLITDTGDQNGNHTTYTYDTMLRTAQANYPDGGKTVYTYNMDNVSNALSQVWTWSYFSSTGYTDFRQHVDALGRIDRTAYWNAQGSWDMQDTCFNPNGEIGFVSYAYQNAAGWNNPSVCSGAGDSYSYDALGRATSIVHSDSSSMNYAYTGRAKQVQEESNGSYSVTRITQSDGLGRLAYVCEVSSGTLMGGTSGTPASCGLDYGGTGFLSTYGYDTLGNLTHVDQGGYATRGYGYDSLSRLTSEAFPEQYSCTTNYSYDNDNLLTSRGRPAPNQGSCGPTVTTTYSYDQLHRLRTRSYSDGTTPTATFNYDESNTWGWTTSNATGRLTSAGAANTGDIFPSVDAMGRVLHNGKCTPRTCGTGGYDHYYTYDYLGDVTSFNNTGLYTLTETYNSAARLTSIASNLVDSQHPGTIINNISYGAFGISNDSLGNGINESFGFNTRGALNSYSAGTAYSFTLGLAADSLVTSGNDSVNGNWSYSYDQFDRIASASKTSTNLSWNYDRFGNRWQQNGGGSQYTMDTNNHINNPDSGISYDVLGNVLNDGLGHSFIYDAENRVISMNSTSYVYDAFGRRVKNGSYEFLYDLDGNAVALLNASNGGWAYGEIYGGGRHIATYSGGTTNFLHTDWVGTKRAMTSVSGAPSMTCTGLPFGESSACATSWNFNSFADYFHDSESNTEHTQFRQLSTTQGRWLSPDPYRGSMDLTNPQSLNRYAYVLNNPLNATDPSGLCDQDFEDCDGMLGGLLGGGVLGGGVFGGGGSGDPSRGIDGGVSGGVSGAGIFGGETLGLPNGLPIQNPGLLGAILPDLPDECDFGPCSTPDFGNGFADQYHKCRIVDPFFGSLETKLKFGPELQAGPVKIGLSMFKNVTTGETGSVAEASLGVAGVQAEHPTPDSGVFNGGGPENINYSASFLGFQYDFRSKTINFSPSKSFRLGLQIGLGVEIGVNSDKAEQIQRSNQICRQQGGS